MMNKTYEKGIYIHIPFGMQKCVYCDFLSAPADDETKEKYVMSLIKEINKSDLEKLGITGEEDTFIVNYKTGEVINKTARVTNLNKALYVYSKSEE